MNIKIKPKIRQAYSKDISKLSSIIRVSNLTVSEELNITPKNCPAHTSNCTSEWIKRDFNKGIIYYILEQENILMGCVALEIVGSNRCYLERLAVKPEYRHHGYGKLLVENFILAAKKLNMKTIGIGTIGEHTVLTDWYKNLGFIYKRTKQFPHLPFSVSFMVYKIKANE